MRKTVCLVGPMRMEEFTTAPKLIRMQKKYESWSRPRSLATPRTKYFAQYQRELRSRYGTIAQEMGEPEALEPEPQTLQHDSLAIRHNETLDISACSVTVRNRGTTRARNVAVSFRFRDGTLVPATGPETIAAETKRGIRLQKNSFR